MLFETIEYYKNSFIDVEKNKTQKKTTHYQRDIALNKRLYIYQLVVVMTIVGAIDFCYRSASLSLYVRFLFHKYFHAPQVTSLPCLPVRNREGFTLPLFTMLNNLVHPIDLFPRISVPMDL